MSTIQEEVHRYAIAFHRQQRAKNSVGTTLTKIPGIGESRARLLLRHFGSLRAVREADADTLASVKGMTRPAAEAIVRYFEEQDTD